MPADKRPSTAVSYMVIPARLASTRLPRKLLLRETGKPLIQHTHEAAQRARRPRGLCVAADHEEIAAAVRSFGGHVRMTSPHCASGTDRVAEIAREMPEVDIFVNVQGDEPELPGEAIDRVVELLELNPDAVMATLATPIRSRSQLDDPACVKVVFAAGEPPAGDILPTAIASTAGPAPAIAPPAIAHLAAIAHPPAIAPPAIAPPAIAHPAIAHPAADRGSRALYFSRSPIPHARQWDDRLLDAFPATFYQHVGLYAYRRDFLLLLASLPRTPLEKLESLEQLRVLEHGHSIVVGVVDERTVGIDTPEDYRAFVERARER